MVVEVDDGTMLASGCCSCLSGRPSVSLGADMPDGRGDGGIYLSWRGRGQAGSEAQVEIGQGELDDPDLVIRQTARD